MAKRIRVRGVLRPEPDVRLYALALIELARQWQAEEGAGKDGETPEGAVDDGTKGEPRR
jgi:hypothetical protein